MSIDRADKPWIGDRRFTEYSRAAEKFQGCPSAKLLAGWNETATAGFGVILAMAIFD